MESKLAQVIVAYAIVASVVISAWHGVITNGF